MSKGLHGYIKTLERMLEMKVAKLRTAQQLHRDTAFYRAEIEALGAAIKSLNGEQTEITRMRKCIQNAKDEMFREHVLSTHAWLEKALEGNHVINENSGGNGKGVDGRSEESTERGNISSPAVPKADR